MMFNVYNIIFHFYDFSLLPNIFTLSFFFAPAILLDLIGILEGQ